MSESKIVADERVAQFVSNELGFGLCPPWTSIGIEKDGKIIGGVIFNIFEGADVHVSVAGQGFTRRFLEEVGKYVYGQLGCERMTIQTEHEKVVDIAKRLGGKVEGTIRSHFGLGRDATLVGILEAEYKFKTGGWSDCKHPKSARSDDDGQRTGES